MYHIRLSSFLQLHVQPSLENSLPLARSYYTALKNYGLLAIDACRDIWIVCLLSVLNLVSMFSGSLLCSKSLKSIMADDSSRVSHRLGPIHGWRSKRLRIALALRKQGWTYKAIGEHLYIHPKSIMRDIKCYVIKTREKQMLQEVKG